MRLTTRFKRIALPVVIFIVCLSLAGLVVVATGKGHHHLAQGDPSISDQLQALFQSNGGAEAGNSFRHAFYELAKLLLAAVLGIVVASVHKRTMKARDINSSLVHAEILLCVSGALMMVIIGNSLARAFGLFGAASFIRFRTPMKDPKDTTVLFLVVGIGMACGLGLYAIPIVSASFLVAFLWLLYMVGAREPSERLLTLEVVATGFEKPYALIQRILQKYGIHYEIKKIAKDENSTFQYDVTAPPDSSIEKIHAQVFAEGGEAIKSISWEARRK